MTEDSAGFWRLTVPPVEAVEDCVEAVTMTVLLQSVKGFWILRLLREASISGFLILLRRTPLISGFLFGLLYEGWRCGGDVQRKGD